MGLYPWYLTEKRENLLKEIEKIPEFGKQKTSGIIELALEEFIKKHKKSNNPQTTIPIYNKPTVAAIPNFYEMDPDIWMKFGKMLNENDWKELLERLDFVNKIINDMYKLRPF